MKIFTLLFCMLMCQTIYAWEKINDEVYSIYGTRISQSSVNNLKPFVEIVYNKAANRFGISFIDSNGTREIIQYGIFNMRTCGINTSGAIAGSDIIDVSGNDHIDKIFLECNRPMFFRVWSTNNEYVTYKFENIGPIPKEN